MRKTHILNTQGVYICKKKTVAVATVFFCLVLRFIDRFYH